MRQYITTERCLKDFFALYGNRYDYSKMVYVSARRKMEIVCVEHGSFFMSRNDHLNGHGCPKCGKKSRNQKVCAAEKATVLPSGKTAFEERYSKIHAARLKNDPNTYRNAGLRTIQTKRETILPDGKTLLETSLEKALRTKEQMGMCRPIELLSEWELYQRAVRKETRKSLAKHGALIGIENGVRSIHENHVDHKLSVIQGFRSSLPPSVIGHICNLQFIPCAENWKKNFRSCITAESLLALIEKFNDTSSQ